MTMHRRVVEFTVGSPHNEVRFNYKKNEWVDIE